MEKNKNKKVMVLIVRGGNFSMQNKISNELVENLRNIGFIVRTPWLIKDNFIKTINKLNKIIRNFDGNIILIGISSGAFIASQLRDHKNVIGFIILCGILTPSLRMSVVPSKSKNTLKFFHTIKKLKKIEKKSLKKSKCSNIKTILIISKKDKNLPFSVVKTLNYQKMLGNGMIKIFYLNNMNHRDIADIKDDKIKNLIIKNCLKLKK